MIAKLLEDERPLGLINFGPSFFSLFSAFDAENRRPRDLNSFFEQRDFFYYFGMVLVHGEKAQVIVP